MTSPGLGAGGGSRGVQSMTNDDKRGRWYFHRQFSFVLYLSYILLFWFIERPGGVSLLSYEQGNHWHWGYPHATNDEKKTLIKKGETHRGGPIVTSGNRVKNWNWFRVWDNLACTMWSPPITQVSPSLCIHVVIVFYPRPFNLDIPISKPIYIFSPQASLYPQSRPAWDPISFMR